MSKLADEIENIQINDHEIIEEEAEVAVYPKKLRVDGYDVNHYYDGDIPVYEIRDTIGEVVNVAHSTSEMHEFTSERGR